MNWTNLGFFLSTLLAGSAGLESAKTLIAQYKQNKIPAMTPDLWYAKKVVDSTLHPGRTELPLRGKEAQP